VSTSEERMQILKMIENKQVTAEEGAKLLEAVDDAGAKERPASGGAKPRWFRVHVTDARSGKKKVDVNIPLGLVNVGMRMGAKFAPDMSGIDVSEIMEAIKQGAQGRIIDVQDDEDGERVEIFVE
jgi:hypothetical protein